MSRRLLHHRTFWGLLVAFLLELVVLTAGGAWAEDRRVVRNTRLYSGPSSTSVRILALHPPDRVTLVDTPAKGNYVKVRTADSNAGWVYVHNLSPVEEEAPVVTGRHLRGSPPPGDELTARYDGVSRKSAKTSLSNAPLEPEYDTLDDLLETLQEDSFMADRAEDEGIVKHKDSNRMKEEKRNVRVKAWLYAAKYEDDRDFHVIIGPDPSESSPEYLNVEVSGLPGNASSDFAELKRAREQLFAALGKWPGSSKYYKPEDPIPVEVEGSLFWDIEHAPGAVGPITHRPKTSWEIHPVGELQQGHD